MSLNTFTTALEQWIVDTYGASFVSTVGSTSYTVTVFRENLGAVKPSNAPAVRFVVSHSISTDSTSGLTVADGALIAQIFTEQGIGPSLARTIAGTIEADAKRSTFTTLGHFRAAYPQGPGSLEPEGLYQLNLRIPWSYYEAA